MPVSPICHVWLMFLVQWAVNVTVSPYVPCKIHVLYALSGENAWVTYVPRITHILYAVNVSVSPICHTWLMFLLQWAVNAPVSLMCHAWLMFLCAMCGEQWVYLSHWCTLCGEWWACLCCCISLQTAATLGWSCPACWAVNWCWNRALRSPSSLPEGPAMKLTPTHYSMLQWWTQPPHIIQCYSGEVNPTPTHYSMLQWWSEPPHIIQCYAKCFCGYSVWLAMKPKMRNERMLSVFPP